MAETTEPFCRGLAKYLEKKLAIPTNCVAHIPWQERERLFDQGAIQVLWLCGLPYVRKAQLNDFAIELLAVPIPLGSRYRAEPIYFSDVVVKRDSRFRVFHDLRGSSWAYNEPFSHSGFQRRARVSSRVRSPLWFFPRGGRIGITHRFDRDDLERSRGGSGHRYHRIGLGH
jgi:ABC-type phosphate/phosphonate transport system substrate-binding protein